MEVVIGDGPYLGQVGADTIEQALAVRRDVVIGLATGGSPLPIYDELGRRVAAGRLSLRLARAFQLDEYVGLPVGHPQGYRTVLERDFVAKVDIDPANVHTPDGLADDLMAAAAAYEQLIQDAGGVDVQLLGIGTDGHIAFNEPGSSLGSRTRIKTLTLQTREDNARFFDGDLEQVPVHCVTQGIGTILEARHVVLIATGWEKAEAVHRMVEGPVTAMWPASALQMHPHVTVLIDEAAASRLRLASYYRDTLALKPDWQAW